MTSSHKPITASPWLSSVRIWVPVLLFLVILIHGGFLGLGLTDDEAYYWVLAQKLDWGYAYHPPAIAWWIAASQKFLSIFGISKYHELVLRLPSALTSAVFFGLALKWLERAGLETEKHLRAALVLLSVAGLFSLSWMMVPDIPLFLGWTLALNASFEICFLKPEEKGSRSDFILLALGTALAILSKFSAVLAAFSAFVAIAIWAPRQSRLKGLAAVVIGGVIASIPIVIWNVRHEWAAILYQLRDRHQGGGGISLMRYLRFWAIELAIAGPVLIGFLPAVIRRAWSGDRTMRFLLVWLAPGAAVFCIQPLFAEFKPHWALIVWWPLALAVARGWTDSKWIRVQIGYGLTLGALVLVSCHIPVLGLMGFAKDPRLDVTNDLYGWKGLRSFLLEKAGPDALRLPVIGSRYQTASQAAFAIGEGGMGILLPRSIRDRDEWPDAAVPGGVSDGVGPEWPHLKSPVFFVADNRYSASPEFPGALCTKIGRIEKYRFSFEAKWIDVWRCKPGP